MFFVSAGESFELVVLLVVLQLKRVEGSRLNKDRLKMELKNLESIKTHPRRNSFQDNSYLTSCLKLSGSWYYNSCACKLANGITLFISKKEKKKTKKNAANQYSRFKVKKNSHGRIDNTTKRKKD